MIELWDYRRKVSDLYSGYRKSGVDGRISPEERWQEYRNRRETIFATHSQSALDAEQKIKFRGLPYYDYNPDLNFLVELSEDVEPVVFDVPLNDDGVFKMQRFAKVHFKIEDDPVELSLFWVLGYGGGVFLPFRDATNKLGETYGGGRYLLDTIKHADLGTQDGKMILDFNYAYNASCAYNSRWHCPLAPTENWLDVAVNAGELAYPDRK